MSLYNNNKKQLGTANVKPTILATAANETGQF